MGFPSRRSRSVGVGQPVVIAECRRDPQARRPDRPVPAGAAGETLERRLAEFGWEEKRPLQGREIDTAYEPNAAAAKVVPVVAAHLLGWQRLQDFGFIAERNGPAIGAAWVRQFSSDEEPALYIDEQTPEVSIAVREQARGQGVGQMLLRALIAEAGRRGVGLCLNVRHDNPALRLYERVGFQVVPGAAVPNRVGGLSMGMVLGSRA